MQEYFYYGDSDAYCEMIEYGTIFGSSGYSNTFGFYSFKDGVPYGNIEVVSKPDWISIYDTYFDVDYGYGYIDYETNSSNVSGSARRGNITIRQVGGKTLSFPVIQYSRDANDVCPTGYREGCGSGYCARFGDTWDLKCECDSSTTDSAISSCVEVGLYDSCTNGCSGDSIVQCTTVRVGSRTCYTKEITSCGSNTCRNGVCVASEWGVSGCGSCTVNQFCRVNGPNSTASTGECSNIGAINTATISGIGTVYFPSESYNNWTSSRNWCRAIGGNLVTRTQINSAGVNEMSNVLYSGYNIFAVWTNESGIDYWTPTWNNGFGSGADITGRYSNFSYDRALCTKGYLANGCGNGCGDGKFCRVTDAGQPSQGRFFETLEGYCENNGRNTVEISDLGNVYVWEGGGGNTWWSSYNFCASLGKRLMTADEALSHWDELRNKLHTGYNVYGLSRRIQWLWTSDNAEDQGHGDFDYRALLVRLDTNLGYAPDYERSLPWYYKANYGWDNNSYNAYSLSASVCVDNK